MSSLLEGKSEKKGMNKIFVGMIIFSVLAVIAIIVGITLLPSPAEERAVVLENAYREGNPEFEEHSKSIVIINDPKRLFQSYTGLGDIVMQIGGRVRNRGDKTIDGLEISVGMVNTKNELIKDKKVLVVPTKYPELKPGEVIDVSVNVPGFEADDDKANARWKVTAISFKDDNK